MGELIGTLPHTVWQELTHKLMLAEAMMKHGISGDSPVARMVSRPEMVRSLSMYQTKMRALVDLGLRFETCDQRDLLHSAFDLQKRYGLLANDAVVLAVAIRLEADCLVSNDKRYLPVEEIRVLVPSDLRI